MTKRIKMGNLLIM